MKLSNANMSDAMFNKMEKQSMTSLYHSGNQQKHVNSVQMHVPKRVSETKSSKASLTGTYLVEDLLKEKDLSLDTTIANCQAHEAAKQHREDIICGTTDPAAKLHEDNKPSSVTS